MRMRLPVLLVGVLVFFSFSAPFASSQTKPVVVSTNPPNGATGVSPLLPSFSMTFSKPMNTNFCGASTRSWPIAPPGQTPGTCTWSADRLTMTITRYNPQTPLGPGLKIEAYLVDPEWTESYLRDAEGNHLDPFYYSFTIADRPKVVSTNPPDGATDVPAYLDTVSFTFSKPMDTSVCGAATNWPYQDGGSCTWSADKLTMTLKRYNEIAVQNMLFYLNLPDTGPFLKDTDGLYIGPCYFSFAINARGPVTKIPANPQKGFQWPYYLYIPPAIKNPAVLLVEPNNSGNPQKDPSLDDKLASDLINFYKYRGDDLGSPYLVPTFPRPLAHMDVYTQALTPATLLTNLPGLVRIDLQLIAMIDDARARLAASGINVGPKVWMVGFSASGQFANGFALLHPDRIQAVSIGGGGAIVPVSAWKGKTLPYPVGIADLRQLVGVPLDTAAFAKVPVQFYVGDRQTNQSAMSQYETLIREVFGGPNFQLSQPFQIYPALEAAFSSIGSNCQPIVFPGMKHAWPDWGYIREFLEHNRTEPFPPPLPKPLLYTLYFPHVASFGEWETEIALTSTSEGPVRGELRAMTAKGGDPIESLPVTIPSGGRLEITVGKTFQRPQEIAYLAFLSDSGFLAGYTRFYQPGNRTSLALGSGSNHGWFPKVEKDGWTGVAFVNVDTVAASVALTAWDDNGNQVAATTLTMQPGEKTVGMVTQLFQSDLKDATYCRYSSDNKLLGFTVSSSSDGQMLDGLHALGDYISAKK